ncbi:MAG: fumarylacetoacetate hydrolase family protein [Halioglobus sp.]|nr:fumarylacetoacetate hydrolase family protein [Halioglobus sp.]
MTSYVFSPAPQPAVAIFDSEQQFPVRRVFCVGRNYAAHAREMGGDPDREEPFYFTKSAMAITDSGTTIPYPAGTSNFHHEIELVIAIGKPGFELKQNDALAMVFGYASGLDMTRRDLQFAARDKGRPWSIGKDIEHGAIISPIRPAAETGHPTSGRIWLSVNDEIRQDSDLNDLIWSVPEIIAHLSRFYHLMPGDLIYSGTPEGVGPVVAGDRITGGVEGVADLELRIAAD